MYWVADSHSLSKQGGSENPASITMVHQTRSGLSERLYKPEYDDVSYIYQDSTFQDGVSESKYRDKYASDHVSLSENSSSVLDYESFRSKLRSVTSSFSGAKETSKKSINMKSHERDKALDRRGKAFDSRDTGETESQNTDSEERDPVDDKLWHQPRKQAKAINHNVYSQSDEVMDIHFLQPDVSSPFKPSSRRSSKGHSVATFGKGSINKAEKTGHGSITKDSYSSFVSSSQISTGQSSSIDSSNRSDDVHQAPIRSRNAKGIMDVARGMFRVARTKKAPTSVRASSEKRKPSTMSSSQLRTAVKLKLLAKANQDEEEAMRKSSRKSVVSPSVWGGTSRGEYLQKTFKKKAGQRRPMKSTGTKPPLNHQMSVTAKKSKRQFVQSTNSATNANKGSNGNPTKMTEATNDISGDKSFFDSIYDAFESWSRQESQDGMAAYENSRLGDLDESVGNTRRRLEIAPEKTVEQVLPQPPSGSDEESGQNEVEDSETKAEMTVITSVAEAWDEIIESAAVIARHYEVDWRGESESICMKEAEDFREAMKIFREHAARLNIEPNDLFAAVREDASVHENSTSEDDDTIDYLGDLWAGLGRGVRLDRYVDAVDGMLEGFRCGSSRGEVSKNSSIPTPNYSKSQQQQAMAGKGSLDAIAQSRLYL